MKELDLPDVPQLGHRRTTSDDIADALRDSILQGRFEDGQELNQVAIARHYGISRVPLREALRQLQAEGLVSARAHQRTVVVGLTPERVLEVIDIRIMLESYLLERALPHVTPELIAELQTICDEMDHITDHAEWLRRNREFHEKLYAPSNASFTLEMSGQLSSRIERYLYMWSDHGVQRSAEAGAEHRRILEAVARRDARRAKLELEVHLMHTRENIIKLFEASRTDGSATA
ncbi:GntR family transcriptional regulator [Amycolatopsis rhabdoformis]|uniref:GntR family transcriptional regulator n=1 Tax=Amycolatopsis rhabdoformis TaxID=1448059 RepID=A0ABZ1IJ02_9PSEU|nr:GntR family transcriptional regulator [Amycolatopsis rhabdoformis]WSE33529.1 GntR family transcriptional regulator [Amycolatopsis rhabdoformis]